jgi:hypothetical protein
VAILNTAPINGFGSKLDTPEEDGLVADGASSLSWNIFDISMAEIESILQPDNLIDSIWRESVAFLGIHGSILAISAS